MSLDILQFIFSTEVYSAITVYILLLIVFISTLKYLLFSANIENKGFLKIVGGFVVFIVAIISNNGYISFISLFIGGLIIASEEFMQKLVIILRSRSEDIGKNLEFSPASNKEIREKRKVEAEADKELTAIYKYITSKKFKADMEKKINEEITQRNLLRADMIVDKFLRNMYGNLFKSNVKFQLGGKTFIADGIITSPSNTITDVIEVKYVSNPRQAETILIAAINQIKAFLGEGLKIKICIVSDNKLPNEKELTSVASKFVNVEVLFFNLDKNK